MGGLWENRSTVRVLNSWLMVPAPPQSMAAHHPREQRHVHGTILSCCCMFAETEYAASAAAHPGLEMVPLVWSYNENRSQVRVPEEWLPLVMLANGWDVSKCDSFRVFRVFFCCRWAALVQSLLQRKQHSERLHWQFPWEVEKVGDGRLCH